MAINACLASCLIQFMVRHAFELSIANRYYKYTDIFLWIVNTKLVWELRSATRSYCPVPLLWLWLWLWLLLSLSVPNSNSIFVSFCRVQLMWCFLHINIFEISLSFSLFSFFFQRFSLQFIRKQLFQWTTPTLPIKQSVK